MRSSLEQIDVNMQELERLLERTRQGRLEEADYQKLRAAVYRGATKVRIAHSTLHSGDRCPGWRVE